MKVVDMIASGHRGRSSIKAKQSVSLALSKRLEKNRNPKSPNPENNEGQKMKVNDLHNVVERMMNAARFEKNDKMANILSRTADRLSRIGTPYAGHWDGALTPTELKIIRKYVKGNQNEGS